MSITACVPDGFKVRHMQSHNKRFQKIQSELSLICGQPENRHHQNQFQNEQRENIISSQYDDFHVLWLAFLLWSECNQYLVLFRA